MRPSIERANEQLDPRQQLANTPPPQSTTPGLHPVSIYQMAPPKRASNCSLLLIYRPRKDERLSWPNRLTCSGWFTHIVVTRRLQAERRTGSIRRPKTGVLPTVLRNQPNQNYYYFFVPLVVKIPRVKRKKKAKIKSLERLEVQIMTFNETVVQKN